MRRSDHQTSPDHQTSQVLGLTLTQAPRTARPGLPLCRLPEAALNLTGVGPSDRSGWGWPGPPSGAKAYFTRSGVTGITIRRAMTPLDSRDPETPISLPTAMSLGLAS